ncbi:unnamed protein product [Parnassius mnemosyne]|uniref:Peptidase aspartic putative domain-containing protein n=1 Tax=Parnassius mnemosyne TaxID=213953 RepID=A0AAV1LQG6_9NEOP
MGTPIENTTLTQPHAPTPLLQPHAPLAQMQPHATTALMQLHAPDTTLQHASQTSPSTVLVSNANKQQILLSTAIVRIQSASGKWMNARALLNAGSEVNIVAHRQTSLLQLEPKQDHNYISSIGNTLKHSQVSVHTNISSRYNNYSADLTFIVMDKIAVPLPHNYIPTQQAKSLAYPTFFIPSSIDLLIGAELFYSILQTGRLKLGSSLRFLIETTFGWVVSSSFVRDTHEHTSNKNTC